MYRTYLDFLETAENKRRWNIFNDIPWDKLDCLKNHREHRAMRRDLLLRGALCSGLQFQGTRDGALDVRRGVVSGLLDL